MRLESEVHPYTVFSSAAAPTRAVRNAVSLIAAVFVAAILQLAPAYGQNSAPPTSPSPSPSFVAKNIVSDFGAKCDGTADDSRAFRTFNTWAHAQTLQVQLTIPTGSKCEILSASGGWWAEGIQNLLVLGYGATLSNNNSKTVWFQLGGHGQYNDKLHSARLATVAAGSPCVALLTPSQTALFRAGNYALITGFDLQGSWQGHGYGYPSNPHYFEYVLVSSINAATGQICFRAALKNTYKSTWPLYDPGGPYGVDEGGPATLYALNPTWDVQVEYRGLTIDQTQAQTYANARSVTYRDVTFTGSACAVPTQNLIWQAINVSMPGCSMEVDKLIGTVSMTGVTIYQIDFQSSSTDLFRMTSSTVTHGIQGTPKRAIISDSTIASLNPGAYAYGRSDETVCTNCVISAITAKGASDSGIGGAGVNNSYMMSNGIIVVPNTNGAVRWAVPGTNLIWQGRDENELLVHVIDVTQDANNTYVQTDCVGANTACGAAGGFPAIPLGGAALALRAHPAPKFTCTTCSGSTDAVSLSQAPAGVPLYSYSKVTYDQSWPVSSTGSFSAWGRVKTLNFTVAGPYSGARALSFFPMYQFGYGTVQSDGSFFFYSPQVDLRTAGTRTVTPASVTGSGGTDANLSIPSAVWLTGQMLPNISTNVGWNGTITIEVITDQGVIPSQ